MIELNVEKQLLPVITTNFEVVKASLTESIAKYKNMVVTEDGLKICKADKLKLSGMKKKIDDYRKSVKQELLVPISAFEDNCKVLIGLIEDAETPLVAGIEVFNEKIREANKVAALELIAQAVKEQQLTLKYADRLTLLDKYTQLSAKAKATKTDIEQRAFILLQEQDREIEQLRLEEERKVEALRLENERIAELKAFEVKRQIELVAAEVIRKEDALDIANETLISANLDIHSKMFIEDFIGLVENGTSARDIVREINKRKERIVIQETPIIEPVISPVVEIKKEPIELPFTDLEPVQTPTEPVKMYFVEMRVEGTLEEITSLSKFLKENDYSYEKTNSGRA